MGVRERCAGYYPDPVALRRVAGGDGEDVERHPTIVVDGTSCRSDDVEAVDLLAEGEYRGLRQELY